ncbi:MAG TPA: SpoIIE family protein phosphatase [Chitinispirillaceae bacterium]|nr:SpoIIE family protein phosphatase [Chitinispirillaceae bacterium]
MNVTWEAIFDISGVVGCIAALFFIPFIPVRRIGSTAKVFLVLSVVTYLFVTITNTLEHLGITASFDFFEDPVEALFIPFILFFFYASWLWQETQKRLMAERHLDEINNVLQSAQQINQLLTEQSRSIEEDFTRAAEIMQTLLPVYAPVISGSSVCAIHRPSHQVGGDLYDIVQLDYNHIAFFVADATGHGVASALLAMLFKNQLRLGENGKTKLLQPGLALEELNNILSQSCHGKGMFVTAAIGVLDTQNNSLKIVSAGHPPVMLHNYNHADKVRLLNATGPALGISSSVKYTESTILIQPGDRLLMYTDGLYCHDDTEELPATDQIASVLSEHDHHGIKLLYRILENMHCNSDLADDVTMLLLELSPGLSRMENLLQSAQQPLQAETEQNQCKIGVGGSQQGLFVQLYGRVVWTCAVSFHEVCTNAITEAKENGVSLFLDLKYCRHLDSTILGTIHELVAQAETWETPMYLQNLSPRVFTLFKELGMEKVIKHIIAPPEQLPSHMTLQNISEDTALSPQRILHAHETLSAMNAHNRSQFGILVKSLRQEIGAKRVVTRQE